MAVCQEVLDEVVFIAAQYRAKKTGIAPEQLLAKVRTDGRYAEAASLAHKKRLEVLTDIVGRAEDCILGASV